MKDGEPTQMPADEPLQDERVQQLFSASSYPAEQQMEVLRMLKAASSVKKLGEEIGRNHFTVSCEQFLNFLFKGIFELSKAEVLLLVRHYGITPDQLTDELIYEYFNYGGDNALVFSFRHGDNNYLRNPVVPKPVRTRLKTISDEIMLDCIRRHLGISVSADDSFPQAYAHFFGGTVTHAIIWSRERKDGSLKLTDDEFRARCEELKSRLIESFERILGEGRLPFGRMDRKFFETVIGTARGDWADPAVLGQLAAQRDSVSEELNMHCWPPVVQSGSP